MIVGSAMLILASIEIVRVPSADPQAALERFESMCAADSTKGECPALRQQVEQQLLEDLVTLRSVGAEVPPEVYRLAARAVSPVLQALAIRELGRRGYQPGQDGELLRAALASPIPAVRQAALDAAQAAGEESVNRLRPRFVAARSGGSGGEDVLAGGSLVADAMPGASSLGGPAYPGAAYRAFASGPERAFFTTSDPPEKVVAFYTKGLKDKRSYSLKELKAIEEAEVDPGKAMEIMMQGGGEDLSAQMEKLMQGGAGHDWGKGIEGAEGVENPRYLIVDESNVLGKRIPIRVVVVFSDRLLGATAIVVSRPPAPSGHNVAEDPAWFSRLQHRMTAKLSPEPEGPGPE